MRARVEKVDVLGWNKSIVSCVCEAGDTGKVFGGFEREGCAFPESWYVIRVV